MIKRMIPVVFLLLSLVSVVGAQDAPVVTVDNAADITSLMRLGRGTTVRAAFSPDGKTLAVAGSIGVWLYDPAALDTTEEPPLLATTSAVSALAYSPDGSVLASADNNYMLTLWDTTDAQSSMSIDTEYNTIYGLAFNADGSQLAAACGDGSIRMYDTQSGELLQTLEGHTSTVYALAYSPDGSMLASGSGDNSVRLWDTAEGTELNVLEAHTSYVYGVAFSPEGDRLVSVSGDDSTIVWDVEKGEALVTIDTFKDDAGEDLSYTEDANTVAFAPDGQTFAVGGDDDFVRIYDASGEPVSLILTENDVESVAFSPDGKTLATVGYNTSVALWDAASGEALAQAVGHSDDMNAVAWSPDSASLLLGDGDENVRLWQVAEMLPITDIPVSAGELSFSADNTTSVTFAPDGSYVVFLDGFVPQIWEPDLSAARFVLEGDGLANSVAITPDSQVIVSVGSQGVFVYSAADGSLLSHLTDHTDWVQTVAISPDGRYIATGASDGTVRVWGIGGE